jgi:hypothetical protein
MGGFIVPPMPAELMAALRRANPGAAGPVGPVTAPGVIPPGTAALNTRGPLPMATAQPPAPAAQPQPSNEPIRMGPGGVNLAPKGPPGVGASGIPFSPMPTGTKVPQVTDDPAVPKSGPASSPMGAMPQTPNLGSYLNPALRQYQSDLSGYQKADEGNRIDPNAVQPKWWERLIAFGLGATQIKDPQNAGNVASEVVNRRRDLAEQRRSTALAPWTQRLQQDKEGLPLAEAQERTGKDQAELDLNAAKEGRERFTAQSNADAKDELNTIRDEWNKDRSAQAEARLNELAEKNKDNLELQRQVLDLKRDMLDYKMSQGSKAKPGQSVAIESKKAAALAKAKTAYDKATDLAGSDPEARKAADDNFKQAQQDAQDAYEAEINAAGGEATHQDVSSWRSKPAATAPAAAPPASPAKPAAQENAVPTVIGPKDETPAKTASDGKTKIGFYKSTGQWMLVPTQGASK